MRSNRATVDPLSSLLLDVLQKHETAEPRLEQATDAAFHLCLDPGGAGSAARCEVAWSFIHEQVLPHLHAEEAEFFPRAIKLGCPANFFLLMEQDHNGMRILARRLAEAGFSETSSSMTGEQALLFSRFVEAIRWHISREETMLHALYREAESSHFSGESAR